LKSYFGLPRTLEQNGLQMGEFFSSSLLVFASLFPIVNPIGVAPIFLDMTAGCGDAQRRALAWQVARNGFLLLLGSLLIGSYVLEFFGFTLPVVRIAGGLVITAFAWRLLHADSDAEQQKQELAGHAATAPDPFYPLTMPLTVGPGAISVAVSLGSQRPSTFEDAAQFALLGFAAICGLLAIATTVFVSYRLAESIASGLGKSGTNVLVRLSAFILLCIGIQILWNGYQALAMDTR
jgi:multiple antibiotic resistance protein